MHVFRQTRRMVLQRMTEADVDNPFRLNSDPRVMRYLTGGAAKPREQIRDDIRAQLAGRVVGRLPATPKR